MRHCADGSDEERCVDRNPISKPITPKPVTTTTKPTTQSNSKYLFFFILVTRITYVLFMGYLGISQNKENNEFISFLFLYHRFLYKLNNVLTTLICNQWEWQSLTGISQLE